MIVYVLTKRGTLHKATKLEPEGVAAYQLQTFESDNLDQAKGVYWGTIDLIPAGLIKRSCKRCFPA